MITINYMFDVVFTLSYGSCKSFAPDILNMKINGNIYITFKNNRVNWNYLSFPIANLLWNIYAWVGAACSFYMVIPRCYKFLFYSIFQPLISSGTREITILFDQIFMRTCLFQGMVNYIFLLCLPTTPELTDALLSCHLITGRLLEQISLQAE